MLEIKCLDIGRVGYALEYTMQDANGCTRVLTEEQLRYVIDTRQAYCPSLEPRNGVLLFKFKR